MDITTAKKYTELAKRGWGPRREQPSWDRDFNGRQEIQEHVDCKTDKIKKHIEEAVAFSDVIKGGFEPEELSHIGKMAREAVEARKNGKS